MTKQKTSFPLVLASLGIVFGDIGTSPLYALQAAFGVSGLSPTPATVYGIISLIFWSITIVVTVKYVLLMTRADNDGEGGIMALIAKLRNLPLRHRWQNFLLLFGIAGVSLFYGDSIITPAISVLSAVEGVKVFAPEFTPFIVPISLIILFGLFLLQSRGTGITGRLFSPIMLVWFGASALAGLGQIIQHPEALQALLPSTAWQFIITHPVGGFISMGAVVLAITGAEALYADMGHFGVAPIRRAWFWFVFPALTLTYLGQGALVSASPDTISSAYFLMFPSQLQLPSIILATVATIVASQAVIAGAFSIARQAIHLGLLPRMTIIHTSRDEPGQVYLPFLNWLIGALVATVVIAFGSSAHLSSAFGFAISGVLAIDTLLFLVIVRKSWRVSRLLIALLGLLLIPVDFIFIASSSFKFVHGAWLPLVLCVTTFTLISTWHTGHQIILRERRKAEGKLTEFIAKLPPQHQLIRTPGSAVYLGSHTGYAPLTLHTSVNQLNELHQQVIIVTIITRNVPHVPLMERPVFDTLGSTDDGIVHLTLQFGFKDSHDIPASLAAMTLPDEERSFDTNSAIYFVSDTKPAITRRMHRMAMWRKYLFAALARNNTRPSDYYHLPVERTITMTSSLPL